VERVGGNALHLKTVPSSGGLASLRAVLLAAFRFQLALPRSVPMDTAPGTNTGLAAASNGELSP